MDFFSVACSLVSFINLDKLELGNTPTATIEDNKISFVLPSKFPFSYSNHPQGLKTSNSEKKLGFLNSLFSAVDCICEALLWELLKFLVGIVLTTWCVCGLPEGERVCTERKKKGFLRVLAFWILLNVSRVDGDTNTSKREWEAPALLSMSCRC